MTLELPYYLEDVNERKAAGWTTLRLYRDTTPDGSFTSLIDSETLVTDQLEYEFADATGAATHWYRVALYNTTLAQLSTLGDPFRPDVTRLLDVIAAAAEHAGAGFKSVCTANGTVSTLVDALLRDHGLSEDYASAAWIYRPDALLAADQLRRLVGKPFGVSAGSLTPVRDWANLPAIAEVYYLFLLLPPFAYAGAPYSWANAARDGLQESEFEDRVDVGTGTSTGSDEFELGEHLGWVRRGDIKSVWLERYNDDTGQVLSRRNASKQGMYWRTEPNGRGNLSLIVRPAPASTQHVIVTANRRDAEIYDPDDITSCPLRLATRATVWKAYEHLERIHKGKYQGELAMAYQAWLSEYTGEVPFSSVKPK